MDFEQDNHLIHVGTKSDTTSLTNDGVSSEQSEQLEVVPMPVPRRKRLRKHQSTEPSELDVLLLTDQIESLRRDLEQEHRNRQEEMKLAHRAIQRVYNDCVSMSGRDSTRLSTVEQKVETVTGRYRGHQEELRTLKKQIDNVMSTAASLRSKIEDVEQQRSQLRPGLTNPSSEPLLQSVAMVNDATAGTTAGKGLRKDYWSAQIIFVLNSMRPNVFEVDGVAYLKLQSRSSRQKVLFSSGTALSFVLGVEGSFASILRNRAWMPLASHRLSDDNGHSRITLDRLPSKQRESDLWDHDFLETNCVTYDAAGKAHIYLALQRGELTLRELSGAPTKAENGGTHTGSKSDLLSSAAATPAVAPTPTAVTTPLPLASEGVSTRNSYDMLRRRGAPPLQDHPSNRQSPAPSQLLDSLSSPDMSALDTKQRHFGVNSASLPFRNWNLTASSRTSYDPPKTTIQHGGPSVSIPGPFQIKRKSSNMGLLNGLLRRGQSRNESTT